MEPDSRPRLSRGGQVLRRSARESRPRRYYVGSFRRESIWQIGQSARGQNFSSGGWEARVATERSWGRTRGEAWGWWQQRRCKEIVPTCPLPPVLMSSVLPLAASRRDSKRIEPSTVNWIKPYLPTRSIDLSSFHASDTTKPFSSRISPTIGPRFKEI